MPAILRASKQWPVQMHETRQTFASWALAAGESAAWVARTLGQVTTPMVYKTYGRYIPDVTRKDGSALEGWIAEAGNERQPDRHNGQNPGCLKCLSH